MNWNVYSQWFKNHFQREIKDFTTFIIHELDIDYNALILELGSGPGWVSLELARRLPDAVIVSWEQNYELVTIAEQNKIQENITNINFVNNRFENLKIFSNHSFDCIISFKTLSQWNSPQKVFNEINRIVKKDGKFAITDYRKDLKWLARASIWFAGRSMANEFRSYWKKSLNKNYSLNEIVKLLLKTELKNWKMRTTLFDFLIYSFSDKNAGVTDYT